MTIRNTREISDVPKREIKLLSCLSENGNRYFLPDAQATDEVLIGRLKLSIEVYIRSTQALDTSKSGGLRLSFGKANRMYLFLELFQCRTGWCHT